MAEFEHWCGNCQIRVYVQRHYGKDITWHDCPYTCEYATAMRCSTATPTCSIKAEGEEVYDKYTDTAGNLHWTGTKSGEHTTPVKENET